MNPAKLLSLAAGLVLAGQRNSGINHVINGQGGPVITTRKAIVD